MHTKFKFHFMNDIYEFIIHIWNSYILKHIENVIQECFVRTNISFVWIHLMSEHFLWIGMNRPYSWHEYLQKPQTPVFQTGLLPCVWWLTLFFLLCSSHNQHSQVKILSSYSGESSFVLIDMPCTSIRPSIPKVNTLYINSQLIYEIVAILHSVYRGTL